MYRLQCIVHNNKVLIHGRLFISFVSHDNLTVAQTYSPQQRYCCVNDFRWCSKLVKKRQK